MELSLTGNILRERPKAILAVYLSGLLQGIALILFPAAGPIFTDPKFHSLSSGQFGALFTPQIVAAIAASTLSARLATRFGMKRVLRLGLAADLAAMLLMASSHWLTGSGLAFSVLLLATAAVGAGFGFTISALNTYAFDLFPDRADATVTGLHVLTSAGQVGASLILGLFVALGAWWGAPLTVAAALALMIAFQLSLTLKLSQEEAASPEANPRRLPGRLWLYAVVVFLYGACEATLGNWSPIYLEQDAGLAMMEAGLALSVFWAMVTVGRVLFAAIATRAKPQALYALSPIALGIVFLAMPSLAGLAPNLTGLAAAGLALSFFFPYSVSLASAERPALASTASGMLVAAIMLGAGFSANIVGLARESIGLPLIFRLSSLYALAMLGLVAYLIRTRSIAAEN